MYVSSFIGFFLLKIVSIIKFSKTFHFQMIDEFFCMLFQGMCTPISSSEDGVSCNNQGEENVKVSGIV